MFKRNICVALCLMAFGCGTTVEPGGDVIKNYSDFQFQDFQEKLLYLHNKERTSRGYEKLIIDKNLCEYAQKHAEYMVSKNSLTHSSMSKLMSVDKDTSVVGENIAWGQETEESVVSSWMWSPGHRWNILGSSYRRVGFGMKLDKDSRKYWCVVFSN